MKRTWHSSLIAASVISGLALSIAPLAARPAAQRKVAQKKVTRRPARLMWKSYKADNKEFYSAEVAALQYLLRRQGFYQGKPDGVFGPRTTQYVKAFQKAKGLKADGIVGASTYPKLVVTVKKGDKGDAVRAVQTLMRATMGYDDSQLVNPALNTDGVFGTETLKAVKIEQEQYNLDPIGSTVAQDGVVGPQSWCAFLGGTIKR